MEGPFILFDDAREGGAPARLYRDPVATISADGLEEVRPALQRLRAAIQGGAHAAGYLTYEAGLAFEPRLGSKARKASGPLLWFGLFDGFETVDVAKWLPDAAGGWVGKPRPRVAEGDYLAAVGRVREHLFAGDFYQANLTFGNDVAVAGDPLAIYARLRAQSAAGWGGVVRHPEGWLLSLSPEQFFTIRDGVIEAKPMKGTAARGANSAADAAAVAELAADPKQRAENLMIVDLLRNDLARVAETGSVAVPELFKVETFPTLHQMVSRVTAKLREGSDAVGVIETIFPCGSITGAPKIAAIEALAGLEPELRGAYTGSMGWIEPGGGAAFNVMIRTLELAANAQVARLGLGSGLVVDSVAGDEWAECLIKGEFVSRAAPTADLIETMRFDPHDGLVELDRHLDRMSASAADLGFKFDRHAARNELQAATFGRKYKAMARLLLSPTGTMAIEVKTVEEPDVVPVSVAIQPLPVDSGDYRLKYKTTDRRFFDEARRESGAYETVFVDPEGRLTEGSFTNIFVERDGKLVTPPLNRGLMPGILRGLLIEKGDAVEGDLTPDDLAGGFFVGNMLRGLIPAKLA
ncbi:MAG TPA: aminodeoxychorismate synthase component I [Sphingomicrobium sp.]|nr:aminodeoxychorismate synthase component I [Sphingomicrobium sp.]